MSYISESQEREDRFLEELNHDIECGTTTVPHYSFKHGLATSEFAADAVSAMVAKSIDRLGDNYYILPSVFADYLNERLGVSDADCEYLTMMCWMLIERGIRHGVMDRCGG